jgi:hypothetical protein
MLIVLSRTLIDTGNSQFLMALSGHSVNRSASCAISCGSHSHWSPFRDYLNLLRTPNLISILIYRLITSVPQSHPQSPIVLTLLHSNVIFPRSRSAVRYIRDTYRKVCTPSFFSSEIFPRSDPSCAQFHHHGGF